MRWVGEGMHCQEGQVKQGGRIQTPKGVVQRKGEERLLNLAFISWNTSSAGSLQLFTDPRSIYLAIDFRYLLFSLQVKVNAGGSTHR